MMFLISDDVLGVGVDPYNGFTFDHATSNKIGGSTFHSNSRRHNAADLLRYAKPSPFNHLLFKLRVINIYSPT
ncbi:putative (R)-mandelonitrile lyase [Lupinus albus]|uniref:Putative (R)-mandelonitrile lyase n=1 Tax=Lupinus albus TaxID=3870 RepID=A0A6A4P7B3_LUPAL|nr:putative (R)-mandelonitrile lyase [Lupinus albus]